jgi:hemerythrin-like domain-containing protein
MLMNEHALIRRAGALSERVLERLERGEPCSPDFLFDAADFAETYIGQCHHAKEERVLFCELALKSLPPELAQLVEELTQEHRASDGAIAALAQARRHLAAGEVGALDLVMQGLRTFTEVYPDHIAREEKLLFLPAMHFFSEAERHMMARTFRELDADLIHSRYVGTVDYWEHSQPA